MAQDRTATQDSGVDMMSLKGRKHKFRAKYRKPRNTRWCVIKRALIDGGEFVDPNSDNIWKVR